MGRAREQREKGLAQVTFNWISASLLNSTTQIWSVINNSCDFTISSSWKIAAFVDIIGPKSTSQMPLLPAWHIRSLVLLVRRIFTVCSGHDHQQLMVANLNSCSVRLQPCPSGCIWLQRKQVLTQITVAESYKRMKQARSQILASCRAFKQRVVLTGMQCL